MRKLRHREAKQLSRPRSQQVWSQPVPLSIATIPHCPPFTEMHVPLPRPEGHLRETLLSLYFISSFHFPFSDHPGVFCFVLFFFVSEREREREHVTGGGGAEERENLKADSSPSAEPDVGLDLRTWRT